MYGFKIHEGLFFCLNKVQCLRYRDVMDCSKVLFDGSRLDLWQLNSQLSLSWPSTLQFDLGNKLGHVNTIPGPWFNIKMSSYQYRKSHCGDKTVVRSSYLHNGISYTGKMTSLYWIRALGIYMFFQVNLLNDMFNNRLIPLIKLKWHVLCNVLWNLLAFSNHYMNFDTSYTIIALHRLSWWWVKLVKIIACHWTKFT